LCIREIMKKKKGKKKRYISGQEEPTQFKTGQKGIRKPRLSLWLGGGGKQIKGDVRRGHQVEAQDRKERNSKRRCQNQTRPFLQCPRASEGGDKLGSDCDDQRSIDQKRAPTHPRETIPTVLFRQLQKKDRHTLQNKRE